MARSQKHDLKHRKFCSVVKLVVVMEVQLALVCVVGCEVCIGLHFLSIVHYNDCGCKNSNNIDCGSN